MSAVEREPLYRGGSQPRPRAAASTSADSAAGPAPRRASTSAITGSPLPVGSKAPAGPRRATPGRDPVFGWGRVEVAHSENVPALGEPVAAMGE